MTAARRSGGTEEGSGPAGSAEVAPHEIRPRRGLPGGRAVVGGLLVAVAAVGVFAAVTGAGTPAGTPVVVAARDIAPGTVLADDDLEVARMALPAALEGRVYAATDPVVGAVAVGPLAAGELVQAGGLAAATDGAVPTFSLAVPPSAANGGRLQRGDTVQVFATYGQDSGAVTQLLAPEARVVAVDAGDARLGTADQLQVILAVPSARQRSQVINATASGTIALVRTTGVVAPEAHASARSPLGDPGPGAGGQGAAPGPDDQPGQAGEGR